MSRIILAVLLILITGSLAAQSPDQHGDALRQHLEGALASHSKGRTLDALEQLDRYYTKQSSWDLDAPIRRQLVSIWSSETGSGSVGAARYSVHLSDVLIRMNQYPEAESLLNSAISAFEKNGSLYDYAALRAKRRLVKLLKLENKTKEAGLLEAALPFPLPKEPSDTQPNLIKKVEPSYTEAARRHKLSGSVELGVSIDETGRVSDVKIIQPMGLGLDETAVEAVKKWRFKPGISFGYPVPARATVEVSFRLL